MSHSKHIIRKSVIVGLSFAVGVVSTVFAAATYDANIQNRANTLFTTIKSNASKMDPTTVPSYYTLVRTNIASLIQVLTTLDTSIAGEQATDAIIGGVLAHTGTTGTNSGNISTQPISIRVAAGTNIACGDPTRNDYTMYSDANSQTTRTSKIDRAYCNEKGGYIWNTCNGKFTEKRTVDSLKEGDTFDCPVIVPKEPTATEKEHARVSDLFAQKFENCTTEYRIATCGEFMGVYPKTFESYASPGNTGCSGNNKADTNGWNMNYFVEEIPNSTVVLKGWGCSVMTKGGYCRKGTTIEISVEDIKKELGTTNPIGAESWSAGRNSWYSDKFTPGTPNDSCNTKVNEKMYHKEYFTSAFEPTLESVRVNTEQGQSFEWTTKNVEKLSWTCKDSYGRTTQSNDNEVLNHAKYFTTWDSLHQSNWLTGSYTCKWTLIGNGRTRYKDDFFLIQ